MRGFRDLGHRDVVVEVVDTPGSSTALARTCRIRPGARFACGEIMVTGSAAATLPGLEAFFRQPKRPDKTWIGYQTNNGVTQRVWIDEDGDAQQPGTPLWIAGKPYRFDSSRQYHAAIEAFVRSMGYSRCRFDSTATTADHQINLDVELLDLGPVDRIEHLVVRGNEHQSRDDILQFLQLDKGQTINELRVAELSKRLHDSGRLKDAWVNFDASSATLEIRVQDWAKVPPLLQPLSESQVAVMRIGREVMSGRPGGEPYDFVANFQPGGWTVNIVAGAAGLVISWRIEETTLSVAVLDDQFYLDLSSADGYLMATLPPDRTVRRLGVVMGGNDDEKGLITTQFGYSSATRQNPTDRSLQFVSRYEPSAWLLLGSDPKHPVVSDGARLTIGEGDRQAVLNTETAKATFNYCGGSVGWQSGAVVDRAAELTAKLVNKTNRYDAQRPATSLAAYVLQPGLREFVAGAADSLSWPMDEDDFRAAPSIARWVDKGGLAPLDWGLLRSMTNPSPGSPIQFKIATDPQEYLRWIDGKRAMAGPIGAAASWLLINQVAQWWPAGGWPAELIRHGAMALIGRYDGEDLTRVAQTLSNDPAQGPLSSLATAALLRPIAPDASGWLVGKARRQMTPGPFQRDLDALLGGELGGSIVQSITALNQLSPEDREVILSLLVGQAAAGAPQRTPVANSNPLFEMARGPFERACVAVQP